MSARLVHWLYHLGTTSQSLPMTLSFLWVRSIVCSYAESRFHHLWDVVVWSRRLDRGRRLAHAIGRSPARLDLLAKILLDIQL